MLFFRLGMNYCTFIYIYSVEQQTQPTVHHPVYPEMLLEHHFIRLQHAIEGVPSGNFETWLEITSFIDDFPWFSQRAKPPFVSICRGFPSHGRTCHLLCLSATAPHAVHACLENMATAGGWAPQPPISSLPSGNIAMQTWPIYRWFNCIDVLHILQLPEVWCILRGSSHLVSRDPAQWRRTIFVMTWSICNWHKTRKSHEIK